MKRHDDYLKVKIDLPSFQLDVKSADVTRVLPELRKLLEAVQLDDQVLYEEYAVQEMRSHLSAQFFENEQMMELVRRLLKQEDDYRIASADIDKTAMIDLEQQTHDVMVERSHARRAATQLTKDIDTASVKHCVVHISGDVRTDDRLLIVDHIHRCMPTAQIRAFHRPSQSSKITVECAYFGEFKEEED